jgi:hypothetical protein
MCINQQGQYVYKAKPQRCRNCSSKAIASYVFGYPVDFVFEDQLLPTLQQQYQIGGCAIELGELAKSWHCKSCGTDFYKKNPNYVAWD